ncbi:MAG: rRNA maturation RNase YbeY [Desulfovibrionaceae bacterium]
MAEAMLEAVDHGGADVEISLVDDAAIADLNLQYLGCVGPTNVLSFPLDEEGGEDGPLVFGESLDEAAWEDGPGVALGPYDPARSLPVDDLLCDCSDEGVDADVFDDEDDPDGLDAWADDDAVEDDDEDDDAADHLPGGVAGEGEGALFGDDLDDEAFGGDGFEDGAWALGALVISLETVAREAVLYGQEPHAHFARLLAHGLLHLAGLDHGEEMEALTERAVAAVR